MARFQPGCPPGPGRPKGTTSPESVAAKIVRPHLATLTEKVVAAALHGDALAALVAVAIFAILSRK